MTCTAGRRAPRNPARTPVIYWCKRLGTSLRLVVTTAGNAHRHIATHGAVPRPKRSDSSTASMRAFSARNSARTAPISRCRSARRSRRIQAIASSSDTPDADHVPVRRSPLAGCASIARRNAGHATGTLPSEHTWPASHAAAIIHSRSPSRSTRRPSGAATPPAAGPRAWRATSHSSPDWPGPGRPARAPRQSPAAAR